MTSYYGYETVLDPNNITVTQSDLTSFKRDRRLWFFNTYLGLRPKTETGISPLVLGSLVHAALEARYKHGEDILPAYAKLVDAEKVRYQRADPHFQPHTWNAQAEQGRLILEGYEEWTDEEHVDVNFSQWAVEKQLEVNTVYHGEKVRLTGKADLIARNRLSGDLVIMDWKTSSNIARTVRQAHTTDQLPYYVTLLQANHPEERVAGGAFTILLKSKRTERAKPPFYHREFVHLSPLAVAARRPAIDGAIADYVRAVAALHDGVPDPMRIAYSNPGVLGFPGALAPVISVQDTGGNVTGLLHAQFKQINPYDRYSATDDASTMLESDA